MTEFEEGPEPATPPVGVGAQLRAAREAQGMTLEQIAGQTRIAQRHLKSIEDGDFGAFPARTYALGFAKTYAKTVGLDQADVAAMVHHEMQDLGIEQRPRIDRFEPGDPARVPSAGLGWLSVAAVILLLAGMFFAARLLFFPAAEMPPLVAEEAAAVAAGAGTNGQGTGAAASAEAVSGPVVFTSLEEGVWVKFYDGEGRQLMQKLMSQGESFTIPEEAENPQIWTGRPDALAITIGGRNVPRLAEELVTIRDVPVSASALLARNPPPQETSPTT